MSFLPRSSPGNTPATGSVVSSGYLGVKIPTDFYFSINLSLLLCIFAMVLFIQNSFWNVGNVSFSLCNL